MSKMSCMRGWKCCSKLAGKWATAFGMGKWSRARSMENVLEFLEQFVREGIHGMDYQYER